MEAVKRNVSTVFGRAEGDGSKDENKDVKDAVPDEDKGNGHGTTSRTVNPSNTVAWLSADAVMTLNNEHSGSATKDKMQDIPQKQTTPSAGTNPLGGGQKRRRLDDEQQQKNDAETEMSLVQKSQPDTEIFAPPCPSVAARFAEPRQSEIPSQCKAYISEMWEKMVREEEEMEQRHKDIAAKATQAVAEEAGLQNEVEDIDAMLFGGLSLKEPELEQIAKKLDLPVIADRIKTSCCVLDHVKDEDVIVLLGNTGVGKSSLIQAVAGKNLTRKRHIGTDDGEILSNGCQGCETRKSVWDVDDPVPGFEIGHDSSSKTKCFRHYQPRSSSVVYVDAPGYQDTEGGEVDIATTVMFSKVAQVCKRLRFVVLIDSAAFTTSRGGVVREFVKLVMNFIPDFEQHKRAFTFLFTKTEKLDGSPQDAEAARKCLALAVKSIAGGTKDNEIEVRAVLKFIFGCLLKDLPYVHVFNPAFSNVEDLRACMETFERPSDGLTSIDSPDTVIRSALNTGCEAQLRLDVDELVEEFRVALEGLHVSKAERLFGALQFLRENLKKSYLDKAYEKAMDSWGAFAVRERQKTSTLIDIMSSSREGSSSTSINVEDGRQVLRGIARLWRHRTVDPTSSAAEDALSWLHTTRSDALALVREGLSPDSASTCNLSTAENELRAVCQRRMQALRALDLLRTWAKVHDDFTEEAADAEAVLNDSRQKALAVASSLVQARETMHVSAIVFALVQLSTLFAGIETSEVADLARKCSQRIQEIFHTIAADGVLPSNGQDGLLLLIGVPGLRKYRTSLDCLAQTLSLLAVPQSKDNTFARLREAARECLDSVLTGTKTYLDELLIDVGKLAASSEAEGDLDVQRLKVVLRVTQDVKESLTEEQHRELETGGMYASVVTRADDVLCQLREQVENLSQALQHQDGRFSELNILAAKLRQLSACAWFDEHLKACNMKPYMEQSITKLHQLYESFCKRNRERGHEALKKLVSLQDYTCPISDEEVIRFRESASAVEKISEFGEISGVAKHATGFEDDVCTLALEWKEKVHSLRLGSLTCAPSDQREKLAMAMERALGICDTLQHVNVSSLAPIVQEVGSQLSGKLSSLEKSIEQEFVSDSRGHQEKCTMLLALKCWREHGLVRVISRLPDFDGLQSQIAQRVQAAAETARKAIMDISSGTGQADTALNDLDALAKAYANFDFGQTAGATLSDLREVMDLRNTKLEEEVQNGLKAGRFDLVKLYVQPLVESDDNLKRTRLDRVMEASHHMLKERFASAQRHVGDADALVAAVKVLQDAGENLGALLEERYDFRAHDRAFLLRKEATDHLQKLARQLESAVQSVNYELIFRQAPVVRDYFDAAKAVLVLEDNGNGSAPRNVKKSKLKNLAVRIDQRTQQLLESVHKCFEGVETEVELFATHLEGLKPGNTSFATGKLYDLLDKLSSAAKVTNPALTDLKGKPLKDRYTEASQKLSSRLGPVLKKSRDKAQEHKLYMMAIDIWSYVSGEFNSGLENHVSLERGLDLEKELKQLREREAEAVKALKSQCLTVQEIEDDVLPELIRLKKSAGWWRLWSDRHYQSRKQIFTEQICHMLDNLDTSLQHGQENYALAGRSAKALKHVFDSPSDSLKAHFSHTAATQKWGILKKSTVKHFERLCEHTKKALTKGDLHDFEMHLRCVHDCEVGLAGVFSSQFCAAAQGIHKAIFEWLEQQMVTLEKHLREYELAGVEKCAIQLRNANKVLVSTFAFYLDVAQTEKRQSVDDEWLHKLLALCESKLSGFKAARQIGVHYAILRLKPSATEKEVTGAFKTVSLKFHPDRSISSLLQ